MISLSNEKVFESAEASRGIHGVSRSEHSHRATFHVMTKPVEAGGNAVKLLRNKCAAVAARARPYDASGRGLDSSGTEVS